MLNFLDSLVPFFRYFNLIPSALYGLVITLLLILRKLPRVREWWVVHLFNNGLPGILFIAVPLLVLNYTQQNWWITAFLAIPLLALLTMTLPHFVKERREDPPADAPRLRLLTHNVLYEQGDFNADYLDFLREIDADVVAMQEVTDEMKATLRSQLGDLYPHQEIFALNESMGNAVLSKYPVTVTSTDTFRKRTGHLQVEIECDEHHFTVHNVHLTPPHMFGMNEKSGFNDDTRTSDMDFVIEHTNNVDMPLLICGDFNMSDATEDYHTMTEKFRDSWLEAGRGFGFTLPNFDGGGPKWVGWTPPFLRIDYVFHSPGIQAVSAEVLAHNGGSDHHPLLVEFALLR